MQQSVVPFVFVAVVGIVLGFCKLATDFPLNENPSRSGEVLTSQWQNHSEVERDKALRGVVFRRIASKYRKRLLSPGIQYRQDEILPNRQKRDDNEVLQKTDDEYEYEEVKKALERFLLTPRVKKPIAEYT